MFNLLQKANNPKGSWLTRAEAKTKYYIYSVAHELLQCQINLPLFFNILTLVEAGQFLWYSIHPDYDFLWDTTLSQYPRDIIKFFQADALLREGDKGTFYAIFYIFFGVQLVMLLCLIIILFLFEASKKKSSAVQFYALRLFSFYSQLVITIAPLPLSQVFLTSIICRDNDPLRGDVECYTGVHLANMVVAIIGLLILVVFSFLCQLFIIDMNPSSIVPFACPQSNVGMLKLLVKLVLPIYVTLDLNFEHANVFVAFYCAFWLVVLIMRYNSQGYYNQMVTICVTVMESLLFWAALVATLHAFIDEEDVDDTGLYYFLFVSPFATFAYYKIFTSSKRRLLKSNTRKFQKAIQFEKYINLIIQLVDNLEEPENRVELEGLLRCHVKFCRNEGNNCPCNEMATTISKEGEEGVEESKEMWHQFIKKTFIESMSLFSKNSSLHLQSAYFQHEKIQNKYKSLYELVLTEETRPNLQEEFCVFRHRNIVEKEMIEDDIRKTDSRVVDVNTIVTFQEKLVALQAEIGKAVNMQLDFWRELEQTNPNVLKLLSLGSKITIQGDVVKTSYTKLADMNSNHIRMLKLYGNFLKDILHDKFEAQRVLEKAEYAERSVSVDKNFMDNERMKYSENSKTCIITCSGNLHSMGKVLSANNETLDVLQYLHTDLIGQNISVAMPAVIADIHDDLMKNYFETNTARVMGRERLIFPTTKNGYIVPCTLMIKVFPNLDEGIRVVGFLRRADSRSEESHHKTHYIMFSGEENTINGISASCYESFGIPASLSNGDSPDFTIQSIFPDLMNQNMEELKSTTGLVCTIDTSALEQNFLVGRHDSEEMEEDDETKQRRYRTSKVRAILLLDDLFLEKYSVKVLKFVEIGDTENKVAKSDAVTTDQNQQKKHYSGESAGSQVTDVDLDAKSEGSSVSVGSSIGEDSRQLKDMKAKISEKTLPSSISALQKITFVLAAALLIITAIQIDKRSNIKDELSSGIDGIRKSYQRCDLQATVNAKIRLMELLSRNMLSYSTNTTETENNFKSELTGHLATLNQLQFDLGQYKSAMTQKTKQNYTGTLQVESMLIDGSVKSDVETTPRAFYQYISSGQKINEMSLTAFSAPIGPSSAQIPFFYIQRNGLGHLRENIETRSDVFVNYYNERTHDFNEFSLITMILGIVFLVICLGFIIPKIFSVNKTNMKVLSLFGFISPEEVSELAEKCELFMETHLDELTAKRDESYYESEEEELEKSIQQADNNNKKLRKRPSNLGESQDESMQQNYTLQMKEFTEGEVASQVRLRSPASPVNNLLIPDQESVMPLNNSRSEQEKSISSPTNAQDMKFSKEPEMSNEKEKDKDKEKGKEDEEDEEQLEFLEERSKKLKNSKDHNKGVIIVQIALFGFLFLAYFVGDFIHEQIYMKNYRKAVDHLQVICKRNPYIKYTVLFTLEELATNDLSEVYPYLPTSTVATDNYRTQYSDKVSQIQIAVKEAFKTTFPGAFDDYFAKLLNYNNEKVCQLYYTDDADGLAECLSVSNGDVGLITTEVTLVQATQSVMSNFYNKTTRTQADQTAAIGSKSFMTASTIMSSIDPIIESLVADYGVAFNDYLDEIYLIQRLKFIGFIVGAIIIILFVWLPYLNRLMKQIFRTKGLLNMIPMDMLKKSKTLREKFTSAEILNAVR